MSTNSNIRRRSHKKTLIQRQSQIDLEVDDEVVDHAKILTNADDTYLSNSSKTIGTDDQKDHLNQFQFNWLAMLIIRIHYPQTYQIPLREEVP